VTLKASRRLLVVLGVLALASGCANDSVRESETTVEPEPSTSVPRPEMPDVVCMSLQDAQDLIQDQGVFFSRSEDASGQDRAQIVDSNWVVIDQTPAPGTRFSEGDAVLEVLKADEAAAQGLCG
jgi:beta-lactam-binding protein with PASTA domain